MKLKTVEDIGKHLYDNERDACAIIANVKKDGVASHGNVKRTLEALDNMQHRTGEVEYEGDGAGIQTDIPRKIWEKILVGLGYRDTLAYSDFFTVGHFFIRCREEELGNITQHITLIMNEGGYDVAFHRRGDVQRNALGRVGRETEPIFYQFCCIPSGFKNLDSAKEFAVQLRIEREIPNVHVCSFSKNSVVYKVRGDVKTLREYYPELRNPDYRSAISLAHGRFSTNTDSIAERAQMFSTVGHNGEINTIGRLRHEARLLGFQLTQDGSDSQDLDRIVESFMFHYGFSLMETLDILFPPVWTEIAQLSTELQAMYKYYRRAFGSIAQGPAALICRQGDEVVFSCDAMGLRPLWFGETEKEYFASSEKGVVPLETMTYDPIPLAPGEKKGFLLNRPRFDRDRGIMTRGFVEVFSYEQLQQRTLESFKQRFDPTTVNEDVFKSDIPLFAPADTKRKEEEIQDPKPGIQNSIFDIQPAPVRRLKRENIFGAFGWLKDDLDDLGKMADSAKEVIGSMGYDGQLAALSDTVHNLADYFKETVAVVTNPSVDGIREHAHFSTKVFLGKKPDLRKPISGTSQYEAELPILFSYTENKEHNQIIKEAAKKFGTFVLDNLLELNEKDELPKVGVVPIAYSPEMNLHDSLEMLCKRVEEKITQGISVVVLDDEGIYDNGLLSIDPVLAVAKLNTFLEDRFIEEAGDRRSLRRNASLVVKSGALRNVHDIMLCLGLGASAVIPYLMVDEILMGAEEQPKADRLEKGISAIKAGIEKVMSTMGIHEIEGYGKIFASIGFSEELQQIFRTRAYLGSEKAGKTLSDVDRDARQRLKIAQGAGKPKREQRFNNKIWKVVGEVAQKEKSYDTYKNMLRDLQREFPVSVRHILDFKRDTTLQISPDEVNIKIGEHAAPIYISAMSFGSQGETSFRSYAEAAHRLNIICINGEGGEIEDMMGRYYKNRGQQVASARFGVNVKMLNSAKYIEIKIGQGAKPGEGGHLPGFKVTEKIAAARHTPPKIDLISPANNHDIYSIEDLAQLIEELKTVNPDAKISVKLPSIPAIAPIATGVAKAGADIIAISGFEGGTGAARKHSLKYVGFPADIGVKESHIALMKAGLRHRVELWSDAGVRSGEDVVKLMLLGANRVGFGTFAMLAIGCTQCRKCNTGTCHVGITSHFKTPEEAHAVGQKIFKAREFDKCVYGIVNLFTEIEQEIKEIVASLGFRDAQEIVGRCDLLVQSRMNDKVDTDFLTRYFEIPKNGYRKMSSAHIKRPLTFLTRMISDSVLNAISLNDNEDILYTDEEVSNSDRAIGTHLAGALTRLEERKGLRKFRHSVLEFSRGVIPGNGMGAFNSSKITIRIEGGAQDGVAKGANGGKVVVLKGKNHDGVLVDGSVGKYCAYGAQGGLILIQGNADSRAGIRLSGADLLIGGEVTQPLHDELGNIASRANIKGFAFEYMTSGRGMVLGDPGPWMCSGMTGGIVYFRIDEKMGLTMDALKRRLAEGATVSLQPVDETDEANIRYLLGEYITELRERGQTQTACRMEQLMENWRSSFVKAVAKRN